MLLVVLLLVLLLVLLRLLVLMSHLQAAARLRESLRCRRRQTATCWSVQTCRWTFLRRCLSPATRVRQRRTRYINIT